MDKLFGDLKFTLVLKTGKATVDSVCFRLHYRLTLAILIAFSILVTAKQYIGDPIDCISKDDIPNELLDAFCWIQTTFSLQNSWNKTIGEEIPYPGIDKYIPGDRIVKHAYYQWVSLVLFLQAVLFYIPRYIWKHVECKKVENLVKNSEKDIATYLEATKNTHRFYGFMYFMAEIMNFANVVGQIFLIDTFLGGEFTTYGLRVIRFTEWDWSIRDDPMIRVFPRLTKCTFYKFGSSGDVQKHDAMCILPINIVNEKIYVFLWFWFVILAVISAIELFYRAIVHFFPEVRRWLLEYRGMIKNEKSDLRLVINEIDPYDWILLSLLVKNMDIPKIRRVVVEFAKIVREKKASPKKKRNETLSEKEEPLLEKAR